MKIEIIIAFLSGIAAASIIFLLFSEKESQKDDESQKNNGTEAETKPSDSEQKLKNACETAIKAELASEAKSRFIAYITHEIRTCLNIIMGITQVFEEEEKDKLSQKQKDFIKTISDSAKKLLSVTDEVSEFSTREKGERHFFIKDKIFDLKKTCSDIVNDLKSIAQNKGLELSLDVSDSVPAAIAADKTKISHLLYTLLENAIRFTNKGRVELSVSKVSELEGDKTLLAFAVRDSGAGISEDKLKSVFDFSEDSPAEAERSGNVKLGLAVCKYLAESMGGSIKAQSKKDSGTTFTIEIPVKKAKLQDSQSSSFSSAIESKKIANFAGKKALLAEDDPINRQIEKLLLAKYGFVVETAVNGQDAVQKYKSNSYDIIFMDCEMPVMNGFSACREIRTLEKEKGTHTPIIAMTANALAGDKEICLQSGMDDYISKPVSIDKLIEATNKYLN